MREIISKINNQIKREYNYFIKKPKSVIFDHIPKCAGTTVYTFLRNYYPSRLIFGTSVTIENVNKFRNYSKTKRNHYKFVTGHLANLLVDYVEQETIAVVVFRDPIDRIVSHYYYVKRRENHFLNKQVFINDNISLKDYCSKIDNEQIRNFYVKRYSGMKDEDIQNFPEKAVELAFDNISKKYDLVGFQDNIPEFMDKLIEKINLPKGSYENKLVNSTQNRMSMAEMDVETSNAIKKYNSLDISLYDKLRERFL